MIENQVKDEIIPIKDIGILDEDCCICTNCKCKNNTSINFDEILNEVISSKEEPISST